MVYFYSALHRYHGVGSWGLCHSLAIKGKNEIFDFHFLLLFAVKCFGGRCGNVGIKGLA